MLGPLPSHAAGCISSKATGATAAQGDSDGHRRTSGCGVFRTQRGVNIGRVGRVGLATCFGLWMVMEDMFIGVKNGIDHDCLLQLMFVATFTHR